MQESQKQDIHLEMASRAKDNHQAFERGPYALGVQEEHIPTVKGDPQGRGVRASVLSDRSQGADSLQQASASPCFPWPSDFIWKMLLKLVYHRHRKLPEQRK